MRKVSSYHFFIFLFLFFWQCNIIQYNILQCNSKQLVKMTILTSLITIYLFSLSIKLLFVLFKIIEKRFLNKLTTFFFSFLFTEIVILSLQNKITQLASNIKELSRTNETVSALLIEKILNRYEKKKSYLHVCS